VIDHLTIELVYDDDCPNIEIARQSIRDALGQIGIAQVWKEWDRKDPDLPLDYAHVGSPSVFVNGIDVGCSGGTIQQADANCCRVYASAAGSISGYPSPDLILNTIAALQRQNAAS
jgi:hypothetical protein